ncbi:lamin tail domain-containing protein [Sphingobacterium lumbrici]|uniref:lamin tail domain-containing protein n=1 Tax=Sphingobacterium lumbrici TaxID=2559600 RepID=UPI001126BD27|nr:lamin tail domain-containing protein [Sphingobacterium lumbrici]
MIFLENIFFLRLKWMLILLALFYRTDIKSQSNTLIINEIMANPSTSELPNYEYIELLNIGNKTINLLHYTLSISNTTIALPEYLLSPNQYVLLCNQAAQPFYEKFGNSLAISKWPALANSGTSVTLAGENNIDQVNYTDSWYKNTTKKNGGWSLERINTNFPCNFALSWKASEAPAGGTPCKPNSVADRSYVPEIEIISSKIESNTITLTFNIPKNYLENLEKDLFMVDNNIGTPTKIEWKNDTDSLLLIFQSAFAESFDYTLTLSPFSWCGNNYSSEKKQYLFIQGDIAFNDVIINEILFNPKNNGVDFVEIYNQSNNIINLQNWKLGNRTITTNRLLFNPQQYLVLTTDKNNILKNYPSALSENIVETTSLPPYPNEQGNVTLFSDRILVDSLYYSSNMHQSFLTNVKGISLERQSFYVPTNSPQNFVSASTLVGGATPGYANSTNVDNFFQKNHVYLTTKTISPDNDNFEDYLEIRYELLTSNMMLNVTIFDDQGRQINRLIRHQSTSNSGKIQWDGTSENGQVAPSGFYIYHVETYDTKGNYEVYRGGFVLTHKSLSY